VRQVETRGPRGAKVDIVAVNLFLVQLRVALAPQGARCGFDADYELRAAPVLGARRRAAKQLGLGHTDFQPRRFW
jgi:hypothetical protein